MTRHDASNRDALATLICCVRKRAQDGTQGYLLDEGLALYPTGALDSFAQQALDLLYRVTAERYDEIDAFSDLETQDALEYLSEQGVALVTCRFCDCLTPAATAHLHQRRYVGEECWDERLRVSE
jgi:hypothetical protein